MLARSPLLVAMTIIVLFLDTATHTWACPHNPPNLCFVCDPVPACAKWSLSAYIPTTLTFPPCGGEKPLMEPLAKDLHKIQWESYQLVITAPK